MLPAVHARAHGPRHGAAGAPATPHARPRLALVATVLASTLASLFWAAATLALPAIHRDLGATLGELQWTITGAGLAFAATLILAGRLGDLHGRRRLLSAGFALLAAASAGAALAPAILPLIAAVSLMGMAAAILTAVSLALVTETFGAARRAQAIALWGGAGALAYGAGPAVGGVLAHAAGWRWIFWMYVPLSLGALALVRAAVAREHAPATTTPLDARGAALLAAGLVGVSLVLSQGESWGWAAPASLLLLAGGAALLGAFLVRERRTASPLVDLGLFRVRAYTATNLALFCVNFVLGSMLFFLPLFLQELRGATPLDAGLELLPLSAAMLAAMPLGGRLADRGRARAAVAGGVAVAACASWLLGDMPATASYLALLPLLVGLGLGIGVAVTPINVTAMDAVPEASAGTASGVLGTSRGLGTAIGVAVSGALFQHVFFAQTIASAARRGIALSHADARALDGLLAGSDPARRAVERLGADGDALLATAREAFLAAFGGTLRVSAGVGALAVVLTVLLLRRAPAEAPAAQVSARPIVEPTEASTNTVSSTAMTARITRNAGDA